MAEKKPYPGTISSIILSVVVVMILLVPFVTANHLQKVRDGETKYDFKEVMCFDIDNVNQFDNEYNTGFFNGEGNYDTGIGALVHYRLGCGSDYGKYLHNRVSIISTPIGGVVGDYVYGFIPNSGCNPSETDTNFIAFVTTFSKSQILELDITRIDMFIDFQNTELDFTEMRLKMLGIDEWTPSIFVDRIIQVGELTQLTISVEDLLDINTMFDEGERLMFFFTPISGYIYSDISVVFDMQFYCIEEIKIITIDYMGIAMIGGGIFMGFCSLIMLPTVEFSWVVGKIFGTGK